MAQVVEDIWLDWQDNAWETGSPYLAITGGLGLGKTGAVPRYAVDYAMDYPGSRIAIGAPTYIQLFQSDYIELMNYLIRMGIKHHFNGKLNRFSFPNRSTIWLISFDVPPERLKGPEWDLGIMDEADHITDREKYEIFAGRIGRNARTAGRGRLIVLGNPVSHGHWIYDEFRVRKLPGYELREIPTYENRRFLRAGYIEGLERRYPPGTPGHKKWVLGQCGIADEGAVFQEFNRERDVISQAEVDRRGGFNERYRSAMYLHDGQPTGWLQVGWLNDGTMVVTDGVYFEGRAPSAIWQEVKCMKHPKSGHIRANRDHSAFRDYIKAGMPVVGANTDVSRGITAVREKFQGDKLKLLVDNAGNVRAHKLCLEFEKHHVSDVTKEVVERDWSLIRPLEFLCMSFPMGFKSGVREQRELVKSIAGPGSAFGLTGGYSGL